MGSYLSGLLWNSVPDIPDELTKLTPSEKNALVDSWMLVIDDGLQQGGIKLFLKFFTLDPAARPYFTKFLKLSDDELRESKMLRAHVIRVMNTLNSLVDGLDDPELFVELSKFIGRTHYRHNIDTEHLVNLGEAVIWLVEQSNGGRLPPAVEDSWQRLWERITHFILAGEEEESKTDSGGETGVSVEQN